jgi:hypothetical protein
MTPCRKVRSMPYVSCWSLAWCPIRLGTSKTSSCLDSVTSQKIVLFSYPSLWQPYMQHYCEEILRPFCESRWLHWFYLAAWHTCSGILPWGRVTKDQTGKRKTDSCTSEGEISHFVFHFRLFGILTSLGNYLHAAQDEDIGHGPWK